MSLFKGVSAFPITPCDSEGALLVDDLRGLLASIDQSDVQSIGLLGSTGTYAYLTKETRRQAISVARAALVNKPLIVGVGTLRTDDAIQLANDARQEGADGLLLAPVSYTPLLDDEVYAHFQAVSRAGKLPLCVYNNPGTTHFTFSTALLKRLAQLENVTAVKMPLPESLDDIDALRSALPADFIIGYSGDWGCPDCLLNGADAWFSVIAGYLPAETAKLARAAQAGDRNKTALMNTAFQPLWSLFQEWGSLRVITTAAVIEGRSRAKLPLPLGELPEALHQTIIEALKSARAI